MNRSDFLQQNWKKYPVIQSHGEGFFYGRVRKIDEKSLQILNQNQTFEIEKEQLIEGENSELGQTVPFNCVKENDWVAFEKKQNLLFLLSPCLRESPEVNRDPLQWSKFLEKVHKFFAQQGFTAMQTPFLVSSPGVDHHIDFLKVETTQTKKTWTLPTSPEIHLKKLLCQGHTSIFEIKNCFRDDLPGENHTVEFTMLEWYRAFSGLKDIAKDVENLLQNLAPEIPPVENMTVAQAFEKWVARTLTPDTRYEDLVQWCGELGIEVANDDQWNDLFFRIYIEKIEPYLGRQAPLLLWFFPAQQASLSQVSSKGWCQRFELYWQGVELANAYLEVNDPEENRVRFEDEEKKRLAANKQVAKKDGEFFQFLQFGMPPASGIALGLDRLFKCLNRAT